MGEQRSDTGLEPGTKVYARGIVDRGIGEVVRMERTRTGQRLYRVRFGNNEPDGLFQPADLERIGTAKGSE